MTVRCWVTFETGPVLPLLSRTDSRRSGSWDSSDDAAPSTWPARSMPKRTLPSRKDPSFDIVDVAAVGRATAAAGGAPTASARGAPRYLMAAATGWIPASVAGAPSAVKAPEKEAGPNHVRGEGRDVGCATGQGPGA